MISNGLRAAFSSLARFLCEEYTRGLTPRIITNRTGDAPYLERYYLLGGPSEDGSFADAPLTVILHRFVQSDDSTELHSHPWEQSASFILAGGYREERRISVRGLGPEPVGWAIDKRLYLPFSLNVIAGDDFHRVDLLETDCWTLFVTGRKASSWAFWDRATGKTTPWREFIARARGVAVETIADAKRSEDIR